MAGSTEDSTVTGPNATHAAPLPATRFTPGTVIGQRYRIVSLLGEGGMGQVCRDDDLVMAAIVAYGFHLSLAGKPFFRDAILEQQPAA